MTEPQQIDKRKLRLILPCDEYGICWIKGAHIHDEEFCRKFLENQKYFKGTQIGTLDIDSHGYCVKIFQEDCSNPYEWVCEGNYAFFDCSKDTEGATPYTQIGYEMIGEGR
jgi:hypothetical protein